MALDYLVLNNKPKFKIKDKEGNEQLCFDLLPSTCKGDYIGNVYGTECVVNKHYVARPDLISLAFYGTDKYADIICKLNGISNPFELNEDDILIIPPIDHIRFYSRPNKNPSELTTSSSTVAITKKNQQKELTKMRSPNEQIVGDKNFVLDKSLGLIFY